MTGLVHQALLRRHEYMMAEQCTLRTQILGRVRFSDGGWQALSERGKIKAAIAVAGQHFLVSHNQAEVSDVPPVGSKYSLLLYGRTP
jgi:hypothetical protein